MSAKVGASQLRHRRWLVVDRASLSNKAAAPCDGLIRRHQCSFALPRPQPHVCMRKAILPVHYDEAARE